VSGIYRFLKNMESKGLVISIWDAPGKGHAKRLYEITTSGEACLTRWIETLDRYLTTINALLTSARTAVSRMSREKTGSTKRGRRPATTA